MKKNELIDSQKLGKRIAVAHTRAFISYRNTLRSALGDVDFDMLDHLATKRCRGFFEYVKSLSIRLLKEPR